MDYNGRYSKGQIFGAFVPIGLPTLLTYSYRRETVMKRWNGWGHSSIEYPLTTALSRFLQEEVGVGSPPGEATLAAVVSAVPPSRLPAHALVSSDPVVRVRHARGQSLPDWVELRSGRLNTFPHGVAYPMTNQDVRDLLEYAKAADVLIIPYGGGTSVVGHINPLPGARPVLTVDMSRHQSLRHLSRVNRMA